MTGVLERRFGCDIIHYIEFLKDLIQTLEMMLCE